MQDKTREYLRKAAIDALTAGADDAAAELTALLHGLRPVLPAVATPAPIALPASELTPFKDGEPSQVFDWERRIRELFLPFILDNGRKSFTSHEMLNWLERSEHVSLNEGDMMKTSEGKYLWRDRAADALQGLKRQGIVQAPPFGKCYRIMAA